MSNAGHEVPLAEERWVPAADVPGYGGYCPIVEVIGSVDDGEFVFENEFDEGRVVRVDSSVIVTFNVSDFPPASTEPLGVDVVHPDDFLLDLADLAPEVVHHELVRQAQANRRAPRSVAELADALERAGTPLFASVLRGGVW